MSQLFQTKLLNFDNLLYGDTTMFFSNKIHVYVDFYCVYTIS